jgi:hypothetical protein
MAHFLYDCIDCPNPKELEYIMYNERKIVASTFKQHIGKELYQELEEKLGYETHAKSNLRLHTDGCVRFYKSRNTHGKRIVFCTHSSIEYVYSY